jgi:hypothetical protein
MLINWVGMFPLFIYFIFFYMGGRVGKEDLNSTCA